jgi:hypothetical protein
MAFHWYSGDQFDRVAAVREKFPNALLIATEACEAGDANWSTSPSWDMGEHYSRDIIGDLNAGASAWIDWNVWLDVGGITDGFHFGPSHYAPVPDTGGNNGRTPLAESSSVHLLITLIFTALLLDAVRLLLRDCSCPLSPTFFLFPFTVRVFQLHTHGWNHTGSKRRLTAQCHSSVWRDA